MLLVGRGGGAPAVAAVRGRISPVIACAGVRRVHSRMQEAVIAGVNGGAPDYARFPGRCGRAFACGPPVLWCWSFKYKIQNTLATLTARRFVHCADADVVVDSRLSVTGQEIFIKARPRARLCG